MLHKGIKCERTKVVGPEDTALSMGSGELEVFATPAMAALMEETAWKSVTPYLEEGFTTVGTELTLSHQKAVGTGATVTAYSELVEMDGRHLIFQLEVRAGESLLGTAEHHRFIVDKEKFLGRISYQK